MLFADDSSGNIRNVRLDLPQCKTLWVQGKPGQVVAAKGGGYRQTRGEFGLTPSHCSEILQWARR